MPHGFVSGLRLKGPHHFVLKRITSMFRWEALVVIEIAVMIFIMSSYVYVFTWGMHLGMDNGQQIEDADIEVEYGP